jgi:hypothetical protein
MPVHVLVPDGEEDAAAAYILHYGDRFVEDPIRFQILTAGELLIGRRQAMTIFFALEERRSGSGRMGAPLREVLTAAVDDFLSQRRDTVSATSSGP